ncbi:MAG TPA: flagellar motor switch protein FliN [Bryobacteraceae bacterium]|nr:flagellar motor switch protein FliN [Bryobacteraceae bacterium]
MSCSWKDAENARSLVDRWVESLAQVLESMTDQRPGVRWEPVAGSVSDLGGGQEFLWWEQPFQIDPQAAIWIGAPQSSWEYAGALTLKAAGLETVETQEAKNTWFEILGQSLAVVARSIGSLLHREVTTENGGERPVDPSLNEWAAVTLAFPTPDTTQAGSRLLVALNPRLVALISAPPAEPEAAAPPPGGDSVPDTSAPLQSHTMDLLLDVDLPVSISFGKARLPMKEVLKLTTGSIVELNRSLDDPVEVLVNQCLIARGEVVVVEGNYGIRIQHIVSRQDRLRSLR